MGIFVSVLYGVMTYMNKAGCLEGARPVANTRAPFGRDPENDFLMVTLLVKHRKKVFWKKSLSSQYYYLSYFNLDK